MLTIIIGICVCLFLYSITRPYVSFTSIIIMFVAIFVSIFHPFDGYTDWELVEETELVTLSDTSVSGDIGPIYLSLSGNTYTYRYEEVDSTFEVNSKFGTKSTTSHISAYDVTVIEDPECQKPVLMEYGRTAKETLWNFSFCCESSYVFYVPEGTISKEIKLN